RARRGRCRRRRVRCEAAPRYQATGSRSKRQAAPAAVIGCQLPDLRYLMDIAVVDYGMGNLRSVAKALAHVAPDATIVVSGDPAVIRDAARVVLPGQSAMPDTMAGLDASGLRDVVLACLADRPFLGVCLGLQMLFDASEEGPTRGLSVLAGRVRRFREEELSLAGGERLKVPHMGWSNVH